MTGLGKSYPPNFYPRLGFWVSPLPSPFTSQKEPVSVSWKYSKAETLIQSSWVPAAWPHTRRFSRRWTKRNCGTTSAAAYVRTPQFVTYGLLNDKESPSFRKLKAACESIHKAALNISNSWSQNLPHSALEFLITKSNNLIGPIIEQDFQA